jgi:hypothetical protein
VFENDEFAERIYSMIQYNKIYYMFITEGYRENIFKKYEIKYNHR